MIELATAPAAKLHFMTVAELRDQTPARPAWLWDTYIAAGNLTLLIGKPKAGKSTLALGLATALATGAESFLGCDIHASPVVYISEEAGGTLLHKLPDDGAHMHILTRDSAWPKPDWPQLVAAAVTQARNTGARLLVIDTASFWMALAADRGKDAGAVQAAMMPLVQATREGLAVVLVHHSRKAAGEDGDAALGSTAWVFSVDTILEVERPPGENAPPTQRLLIGLGRHPSTPPCALIDLDPATGLWALSGHAEDRQEARAASRRAIVLAALASGGTLTRPELEDATGATWRDLIGTINNLRTDGLVTREGAGRKGDPYRFRNAVANELPQHPTAPTESVGSTGPDSVVCCVATPQNQAAVQASAFCGPTESAQLPSPPARPDPLPSMPQLRPLQDVSLPVGERQAPKDTAPDKEPVPYFVTNGATGDCGMSPSPAAALPVLLSVTRSAAQVTRTPSATTAAITHGATLRGTPVTASRIVTITTIQNSVLTSTGSP